MNSSDWGGVKGWEVSDWDCIWSKSGSVDSLKWLPKEHTNNDNDIDG